MTNKEEAEDIQYLEDVLEKVGDPIMRHVIRLLLQVRKEVDEHKVKSS